MRWRSADGDRRDRRQRKKSPATASFNKERDKRFFKKKEEGKRKRKKRTKTKKHPKNEEKDTVKKKEESTKRTGIKAQGNGRSDSAHGIVV